MSTSHGPHIEQPPTDARCGGLTVQRVGTLDPAPAARRWLVEELWGEEAVGIIGGSPKCCKTFFGLDLATSIASGTPVLGRYRVVEPGPVLVYLAEDALPMLRQRVAALCAHRGIALDQLDLHVITEPELRLDNDDHCARLARVVERHRPRLVLLDPLVRLHRCDENDAGQISALLGYLRNLQRQHRVAIAVVHHMSKRIRADLGQALRGSGDIHAWVDVGAYLVRRRNALVLTLEHRAARSPDPIVLDLVSHPDGIGAHLDVVDEGEPGVAADTEKPLSDRVIALLRTAGAPMPRQALRASLRVNNSRLGDTLEALVQDGSLDRTQAGWQLAAGTAQPAAAAHPAAHPAAPKKQLGLL